MCQRAGWMCFVRNTEEYVIYYYNGAVNNLHSRGMQELGAVLA
jgi:hypothetical protein